MLGDTLRGGPRLGIKIPVHEQLAEAEQRKRRQFLEITLGRVVEDEVQHVCTGFFNGRFGGTGNFAAYSVELFLVVENWQR